MTLLIAMMVLLTAELTFAQGFTSVTNLNSLTVSAITGEKPQSKVWTYAGRWWAVMPNSTGTHLWRLDGTIWTSILDLDGSTATFADCKAVGSVTHILLYKGTSSSLVSVEYVPASTTYQLWTTRTSTVSISLDAGVETATIDVDGNGRMWLANAGTAEVYVRWSDSPYSTWSSPISIASGINDDDICAVTAFAGKIGVLWSNQNTQRFGFKSHVDGTDPATWSNDEVPASQSALSVGGGMADDHLNFAVASDGTIYAAVKTSYNDGSSGNPQIAMLIRRPGGTWDNLYEVSTSGTRAIVVLNEIAGKVKVIYTSSESGGNILYRESSISTISFGSVNTLISGTYNNATSTKQSYPGDVVILAGNGSSLAGILGTDATPNLVAHWKMDETSGTMLYDASTFGNNATTVANPTFVPGIQGNALQLNGTSQYATAPNSASLDINGAGASSAITLAAWVKPTNTTATTQNIIKKANTSGITDGYELSLGSSSSDWPQKVFFRINQLTSADGFRVNSTTVYPLNGTAWMHVAATFDGITMKLYINGIQEGGDLAGPASGIASNTLAVGIGAQPNAASKFMGLLDDARIYNRALTLSEIQTLASAPPTPPSAPTLLSPADGSTSIALNPTLTWNASSGATSYQVQVSIVSNFLTTVYDQSGITSTNTSVSGLSNVTLYYWRVNATNANGTSAWSSVRSFTTIASTPTVQDNGAGYALDFDGLTTSTTGDYVNCGNASTLDIKLIQSLTIEAWIRPSEYKTHSIVKKFASGFGYELFLEGPSPYRVSIRLNGAANTYRVYSSTPYPIDGTWMHVAGTFDYLTNTIKLFINGIQEGATLTGPGSIGSTTNPLMIGADMTDYATKGFKGRIDEVRVWNVARSDADIKANMTKKLVGNESGLVGYWRFDETTGTSMKDETSNHNDGTMTNMDPGTDHVWSGAALGDASAYDYVATGGYTATLSHTNGDALTATTTSVTPSGIQVYRADDNAVRTGSTGLAGYSLDPLRFWGVKAYGTTPVYTVVYNYTGNPNVISETGLKLVKRNDISVAAWTDAGAILDQGANTLSVAGQTGTEYALAIPINSPPNVPTLNTPANSATGVSTSPILDVTASDPDGGNLTVAFYGRPKQIIGADFTIVALPDAQNYTAAVNGGTLAMFTSQTTWCVAQKTARNIVYVAMEGDITNDNNDVQWNNAVTAMSILESPSPGIPYGIALGNHDGAPGATTLYNEATHFGEARFAGRSYYGGHYGTNNDNNYALFSASGLDFIVINLGSGSAEPTADVLLWANTLMQNNINKRAIVVSHHLLSGSSWNGPGQVIYDALKGNPNLFMMLCGHLNTESMRTNIYNGNTIYTVLTDYQGVTNGGNGWLRIFTFSPANNNITLSSYSPFTLQSNYSAPTVLPYNMTPTNNYQLIGTNTGVASGTTTGISWPSLASSTEYEWYTTVSDGVNTVTSPSWSFTTAPATYQLTVTSTTGGIITAPTSSPVTVNQGDATTITAAATTGYTFTGWTVVSGGGVTIATPAALSTTVTLASGNAEVRANFTINQYTVTFDANTGTGTMSSQTANYNTPAALTLNAFTKTGYSFSGWNTAVDGSGTSYDNGAIYDFTANITLYAQWMINIYTVTFDANTGTGTMSSQSANYNTSIPLTLNAFTKTGYSFSGWNTAVDGSGTSYADGEIYNFTASITLYAQWAINTYTLTYTAGANGSITGTSPQTVNYGASGTTVTAVADPGYHFVNWSDGILSAERIDVNVTANISVTANFAIDIPDIPSAPTLNSPADLAPGIPVSPTLTWYASSGAASYQVQVSTSQDFTSTVFDQSGITGTAATITPALTNNTTYFWRVNATNAGGTSSWSVVWSFTADPMVAHYMMNEGSGTTFQDASSNSNNASVSGTPLWTTGIYGQAFVFDGTTSYALANSNPGLNITNAITLAVWVRPEQVATQDLIKKATMDAVDGYELTLAAFSGSISPQRPFVRFNQKTSGNSFRLSALVGSEYPINGTWIHYAATYDGTTIKLYINGILNNSMSASITIATNTLPLSIGAQNDANRKYKGVMDDARVYNRALSESEIQALATLPPVAPTLASPSNGSTGVSTLPTLTWNASSTATSYQVQVSTDINFGSPVFNLSGITETSIALTSALSNSTLYYWRVNAANVAGTSGWSAVWNFTTITGCLPPSITGQPLAMQTVCKDATLSDLSVIATGDGLTYQWYSNTINSNIGGALINNAINAIYTPPTSIAGTLYYYCMVVGTCGTIASNAAEVIVNPTLLVSGYFNYSNAGTPLNGVSIELQQEGDPVYNTSTDAGGHFTLLNVCPGTYDVVATSSKTTGGINVTDAAQANYWGVFHGGIEKVRFLAGDVNGDNNVASADASNILQYFLTQGNPDPAFASQWSFWKTGDQLITNNPPGPLGYPTITVAGSNVTQNLYGLVTGDFNQSFVPGSTKAVSESLTLIFDETISVIPDVEFDLPLSAAMELEVGAVSLILDFPSDLMEVNGVYLTDDPNTPVMYEVSGDELRIGWNSIEPVSLLEGESLLTLRVKVIGSTGEEGIRFKLAADPLNELADGNYNVISNAVLSIDIVKTVTTGTGEISLSERLTLTNHPNPFKGTTNFVYSLPADGKVTLEIYDIVGNKVKSLVDETQPAGDYVLPMDEAVLQSGVYTATLRLNSSGNIITRTIKLISKK